MSHARWLRGAVIQRARRPEFHQHNDEGVIYRHPLIRYDVSTGFAELTGLAEGALLLRALPAFEALTLGSETVRVRQRIVDMGRIEIGPTTIPLQYTFQTPYLALNQENYQDWERGSNSERRRLLSRVV